MWRTRIILRDVLLLCYTASGFPLRRGTSSSFRSCTNPHTRFVSTLPFTLSFDSTTRTTTQSPPGFHCPWATCARSTTRSLSRRWMTVTSNDRLVGSNETWSNDGEWDGLIHNDDDDDDDDDDNHQTPNEQNVVDELEASENDDDQEHDTNDNDDEDDDDEALLYKEYTAWSNALNDAITSLDRKRTALQSELSKAQGVEDTVARAQLLVSHLYLFTPGVKSARVQDWEQDGMEVELVLNPKYDTASAEADALFAQARKLKRGSVVVSELLEQTASSWEGLQEARLDLDSVLLQESIEREDDNDDDNDDNNDEDNNNNNAVARIDQGRFFLLQDRLTRMARNVNLVIPSTTTDDPSTKQQQTQQQRRHNNNKQYNKNKKPELGSPASNIRKLQSPGGCTILIGRNRRGNEHLSLKLARGTDIWMHSRGCPGAHVVIQNRRGGPTPTDDCLQLAADLAIFYSDFRTARKAPVVSAEPKHLLKPRGAPLGAIKVRQEGKTYIGHPDDVPEECKEAREESGQSNYYYRSYDKAKHRRRTQKAAKEESAKRKKQQRKQQQQQQRESS